jgi:hypothetical protein
MVSVPQILSLSLCGGAVAFTTSKESDRSSSSINIIVLSTALRHLYVTGGIIMPAAILASWRNEESAADGAAVALVSLLWVWSVYSCLIWALFPLFRWLSKGLFVLMSSLRMRRRKDEATATISKSYDDSKSELLFASTPRKHMYIPLQRLAVVTGVLSLSVAVSYGGWWRGVVEWPFTLTLFSVSATSTCIIVMKAVAFLWFYIFLASCAMMAIIARPADAHDIDTSCSRGSFNQWYYVAATVLLVVPVHVVGAFLYALSILSEGGSRGVYSSVERGNELLACMAMHAPLLIQLLVDIDTSTNILKRYECTHHSKETTNEILKEETGVAVATRGTFTLFLVRSVQFTCLLLLFGNSVYAFQSDQSMVMHTTRGVFCVISTVLCIAHLLKLKQQNTNTDTGRAPAKDKES